LKTDNISSLRQAELHRPKFERAADQSQDLPILQATRLELIDNPTAKAVRLDN
jgi:hypothetical protein